MKIVVSDTGPLRYLVELGAVEVLSDLYGIVLIPPVILQELRLAHFPAMVRAWAEHPPAWLIVEPPLRVDFQDRLHGGEAAALSLALERKADLLLMDERQGTEQARGLGLEVRGTLGILAAAGARGKVDFDRMIDVLTTQTRFRAKPDVIAAARRLHQEMCRERDQKNVGQHDEDRQG